MITHAPAAFTLCFVSRWHQYAADLEAGCDAAAAAAAAVATAAAAAAATAEGQPADFATWCLDRNKSPLGTT